MSEVARSIQARIERVAIEIHEARVTWLTGGAPRWADGTPVSPSDRECLLRQSRELLATIKARRAS